MMAEAKKEEEEEVKEQDKEEEEKEDEKEEKNEKEEEEVVVVSRVFMMVRFPLSNCQKVFLFNAFIVSCFPSFLYPSFFLHCPTIFFLPSSLFLFSSHFLPSYPRPFFTFLSPLFSYFFLLIFLIHI